MLASFAKKFKIKEFVIRQNALNTCKFEYVSDEELDFSVKGIVLKSMDYYLEPGLKAIFEKKDIIKRTNSGKLKQFFREF